MPRVVAAGFFDGVHLGHRRILEGADAALTFRNHPSTILCPERVCPLLTTYAEKASAIRGCGVKDVIALDFTPELASASPEKFIDFLRHFSKVRCGVDWRFGKDARGDADFLRAHGFDVEIVPYAEYDGERISSTRIRAALARGDIGAANGMLGRRWSVTGEIVSGKGVGRDLGYPTVNLRILNSPPEPPTGVYEVFVFDVKAIANFGYAPTMGERAWKEKVMEIHFKGDCPPEVGGLDEFAPLRVELSRFVRPERKFADFYELKAQISADCAEVFGVQPS